MLNFSLLLQKIIDKTELTADEMSEVMHAILQGQLTPAQLAAFLIAMRMKGETVTEIATAAQIMQQLATHVKVHAKHLVDIVGTGGDQTNTFNISTTCAFVVAAAGGVVAKHGNRSLSSKSGSADVLETAGINLNLAPTQIADCIQQLNIGFMFAPAHHTAMQHAIAVRKELGVRTFFNLLGPLTNPAQAKYQLMGVYSKDWVVPVIQVLHQLGSQHALVVHSEDGLDEISIAAPTYIAELKNGAINTTIITPEQFGFARATLEALRVTNSTESLAILMRVLENKPGPARDIVSLNAGAAIYIAGLTEDIQSGIALADKVIANGNALKKFRELIKFTQQF